MTNKIVHDEQQLARDLKQQQLLLKAGLKTSKLSHSDTIRYPDGCSCSCPSSGCDEEKGEGPVCKCPTDAKMPSLPDPVDAGRSVACCDCVLLVRAMALPATRSHQEQAIVALHERETKVHLLLLFVRRFIFHLLALPSFPRSNFVLSPSKSTASGPAHVYRLSQALPAEVGGLPSKVSSSRW